MFVIIGPSLTLIHRCLKSLADRSSIDSREKGNSIRLIVQLRFGFLRLPHTRAHRSQTALLSYPPPVEKSGQKGRGLGAPPPTIIGRETRLDEARLQPRTALIEPIAISQPLFQTESERLLDSREDPCCLSANAVAWLEKTTGCRRERLERREPTGIG